MADRFRYQAAFKDGNGSVVRDATVTVYLAKSNTLAHVFEDETGGTAQNSVTTDSTDGGFGFWAALGVTDPDISLSEGYKGNQDFKIVMTKPGFRTQTYDNIKIYHRQVLDYHTFVDGDITPDVSEGNSFITANTGATIISDLDNGYEGQRVFIVFGDGDTTVDFTATNLKGNGGADWGPNANDAMFCSYNHMNGFWYCLLVDV